MAMPTKLSEKVKGRSQGRGLDPAVPLQGLHGVGSYAPCNMCVKAFRNKEHATIDR